MRAYKRLRTWVLLGAVATLAVGCPEVSGTVDGGTAPDAGAPDAGAPDAGDGCVPLTLGARDFQTNLFGQLIGVRYPASPHLGTGLPQPLRVELYDSTTGGLPPLRTGTFALGEAPNDSLDTCQHCIWMPLDWDGVSTLEKVLIATEGTLTLTRVDDPLTDVFAGETDALVLREATITETGVTTLVEGGRCARLQGVEFDTSPTPGAECLSAEDCGNPLREVCSPATGTCRPHECGEQEGCPAERPVCLTQYGALSVGACYADCNPTQASSCRDGKACVQLGVDPSFGICMESGAGALGEACTIEDTSTACLSGMTCSTAEQTCTNTCRAFTANPGCQAEHACTVLGVCESLGRSGAAAFEQPCGDTATMAQGCAPEGGAFQGICFAFAEGLPLTCKEACFDGLGCEAGEFCAPRFAGGLGVCLPIPVCGDGELGEINEVCDDGNTVSGDGCSKDCKVVEYDTLCAQAPLLTGGDTSGNTASARDGFKASCQLGIARADVYRFEPPGPGRLRLWVDSATVHSLSVREVCAEAGSELACTTSDDFPTGELVYQVTSDTPLTVLISAFTVLEQGPYTLHTEFITESCGDSVLAGREVCDDGNTVSGDGCSSDCRTIEYDAYCAQAPALTSSTTGDNTGAPAVYTASCANTVLGSGPDRLFRYTAPSAGTLRLRLQPNGDADLALSVFDSCGAPASMHELACSSVYDVEQVDVPVTAGQTLTVLVEGFNTWSTSPFTLTAELLP